MFNKSVCRKVSSMLSLYIDNKLSVQDYAFIDEHLSQCDECYKKYLYLKSLIKSLKDSYKQVVELAQKKQKQATFSIREHEKFLDNLSPYVDNELDAQECFEFRKYLMKSKIAQRELKNTYILQKEMRMSFDRAKKKTSPDICKNVIAKLQDKPHHWYDSAILNEVFKMRTAKVAILAGLVLLGTYEAKQIEFSHPAGSNYNNAQQAKNPAAVSDTAESIKKILSRYLP